MGAKFPKMGNSLPRTPMNRPAKYGAASFILGGEVRNRTNTQNHEKATKEKTIYPHFAYRHVWITNVRKK